MVVVLGIPLFLLESSLGQFASLGATAVFKISPLWKGLGYAMVLICWFISLYYNVVIAECLYFLFASFSFPELPWTRCNPDWATPACRDAYADADGYFYSDAAPGASGALLLLCCPFLAFRFLSPLLSLCPRGDRATRLKGTPTEGAKWAPARHQSYDAHQA